MWPIWLFWDILQRILMHFVIVNQALCTDWKSHLYANTTQVSLYTKCKSFLQLAGTFTESFSVFCMYPSSYLAWLASGWPDMAGYYGYSPVQDCQIWGSLSQYKPVFPYLSCVMGKRTLSHTRCILWSMIPPTSRIFSLREKKNDTKVLPCQFWCQLGQQLRRKVVTS